MSRILYFVCLFACLLVRRECSDDGMPNGIKALHHRAFSLLKKIYIYIYIFFFVTLNIFRFCAIWCSWVCWRQNHKNDFRWNIMNKCVLWEQPWSGSPFFVCVMILHLNLLCFRFPQMLTGILSRFVCDHDFSHHPVGCNWPYEIFFDMLSFKVDNETEYFLYKNIVANSKYFPVYLIFAEIISYFFALLQHNLYKCILQMIPLKKSDQTNALSEIHWWKRYDSNWN